MTLAEALVPYVDLDALMGNQPNPSPQSSGNPLVLSAVAAVLSHDLHEDQTMVVQDFFNILSAGVLGLQKKSGIVDKKARSGDQVTPDDLIGFVTYCVFREHHFQLCQLIIFGEKHDWEMSNTSEFYFSALVKPWDEAFYRLATGLRINFMSHLWLVGKIVADALLNRDSASEKQLTWLRIRGCEGRSALVDLAAKFWFYRLKKTYGSVARMLTAYHGERHPFAVYCPD